MVPQWNEARLNYPVRNHHNTQRGTMGSARHCDGPKSLLAGKRILVAEDVSSTAWLIHEILAEAGCVVVGPAATSGLVAELLAEEPVDAVLLDVGLADGPSFSLAESLAANGVPFAFLTGYDAGDIPFHLRHRPTVNKPMHIDGVLNVVRQLCRPAGRL